MTSSLEIGLSGIEAARRGLDTIGNNIANAATDGYHQQRLELTPGRSEQIGYLSFGTGVQTQQITRVMDSLLESEILVQTSLSEAVGQELSALKTTEIAFGEFGGGEALNDNINRFFEALRDLSSHPTELTWQHQLVTAADAMTNQFRSIGTSLSDLSGRVLREAQTLADEVNNLSQEIAALNASIEKIEIAGTASNNLRDQRDQKIAEMAKIIDVDTIAREHGVVDVSAGGVPVVLNSQTTNIEVSLITSTTMGLGAEGSPNLATSGIEGKLGGLLDFKNSFLPDIITKLDNLAAAIADQVNQYHVQGVGSGGSFTSLNGWELGTGTTNLEDLDSDITAGTLYIRLTDGSGTVSRHEVTIGDPASTTLADAATAISAINGGTGLTASVVNNQLVLNADVGYTFDFIPAPLSVPVPNTATRTAQDFTGVSSQPAIAVSGHYTGTSNKTFRFTVSGTGEIGNDSSLTLTVNDGTSDIKTFNIGTGYVPGEKLDLGNGVKVTLGIGDLADTNYFEVDAFSNTDSSGLLAAAGINTFFTGSNAQGLEVETRIKNDPTLVATALGPDYSDNQNIERLADLLDVNVTALDGRTIDDYYQTMVTNLGQDVSIKEVRQDNLEAVLKNLSTRRTEISGVDINEEAARILMFEQMYQAMAKYINTVNQTIQDLMNAM